jgi:hypothetical protein
MQLEDLTPYRRMHRGDLAPCCMMQRGVKLQSTKFFVKFEKNLRYASGSKLGTFDGKNGGGKSRPTVPLNQKHRTHVWLASVELSEVGVLLTSFMYIRVLGSQAAYKCSFGMI